MNLILNDCTEIIFGNQLHCTVKYNNAIVFNKDKENGKNNNSIFLILNENRIVTMEFSNSEDSKSNMQYIYLVLLKEKIISNIDKSNSMDTIK